VNDLT